MATEAWAGLQADFTVTLGSHQLAVEMDTTSRSVAIVGPSGAGKSTLLRVIAGVEMSATGSLRVGGDTWLDTKSGLFAPAWERKVGWVPQDDLLFPHLTVAQNLSYSGASDAVTAEVATLLEVGHLLDRRPRRLSGGERQRVALGRALLSTPKLLLMDEPFAALDRALRADVARRVRQWADDHALPLVLVSHDEEDNSVLADECWVLSGGRVRRE